MKQGNGSKGKPKAKLGGETVESRVLLSATWLDLPDHEHVDGIADAVDDGVGQWLGEARLEHLLAIDQPPAAAADGAGATADALTDPAPIAHGTIHFAATPGGLHPVTEPPQGDHHSTDDPIGTT